MRLNLRLYPGATLEADGLLRRATAPSLDGLLYPGATVAVDGVLRFQILVPPPVESAASADPVVSPLIASAATVHAPSVGAAVAPALVGGASSVAAPAVRATIVAALVAGSGAVFPPTVESGTEPEPEPGYARSRPAPPVPKKKPKPKKKPPPVFVERPAVVIVQPTEPVGVEWSDPVADEETAVVAALYALNAW